jgi:hypothetical protein
MSKEKLMTFRRSFVTIGDRKAYVAKFGSMLSTGPYRYGIAIEVSCMPANATV